MEEHTIRKTWTDEDRIGSNNRIGDINDFLKIEDYIIEKLQDSHIEAGFNLQATEGGVLHPLDTSKSTGIDFSIITYVDFMGGICMTTNNAEVNCRYSEYISKEQDIKDEESTSKLQSLLNDKYELLSPDSTYSQVIFLPGSNLFDVIDLDKVAEIVIDEKAVIKPHPITVDFNIDGLKKEFGSSVIDEKLSGFKIAMEADNVWITYNTELGLIRALNEKTFGNVNFWNKAYLGTFSHIYRLFKYKDVEYNKRIITNTLFNPASGVVFPWQTDFKHRIDSYIDGVQKFIEQENNSMLVEQTNENTE